MAKEVFLPKLGLTMEEGRIVKWCKQEGDYVNIGEAVFEVETDKVTMEVESKEEGVLRKILVQVDEQVPVGTKVAIIGSVDEELHDCPCVERSGETTEQQSSGEATDHQDDKSGSNLASKSTEETGGRLLVSPRAKKLAQEKGIDLRKIKGTGEGGLISADDVLRFLDAPKDTVVTLSGTRALIANRLSQSAVERPHVYFTREIDMSACLNLKNNLNYKTTISDMLIYCVARTLRQYPMLNTSLVDNSIHVHDEINIGLAVEGASGLLVPVIRSADQKTLVMIAQERERVVNHAREGNLILHDLEGGTFTISNLGMYNVDQFTAIINPPESAILAVGKIKKQLVVSDDDQICNRPIARMTLSVDHRVIDGVLAVKFLDSLSLLLEDKISEVAIPV